MRILQGKLKERYHLEEEGLDGYTYLLTNLLTYLLINLHIYLLTY
jgi:hypothetical protein